MPPDNDEDLTAFVAIALWLLGNGFTPPKDIDKEDPACFRNSGCHRIWTLGTTVPIDSRKTLDTVAMNDSLSAYLNSLNKALHFTFHPYSVEIYRQQDNDKLLLYVSVYT